MKILKISGLASVQDMGRWEYLSSGVGISGAMDMHSLSLANAALRNDESAAGIELFGEIWLELSCETNLIIAGNAKASLNDEPIFSYTRTPAKAGDILKVQKSNTLMYSYICFGGGLLSPIKLGSRSNNLAAGFGGLDDRPLKAGDEISLNPQAPLKSISIAPTPKQESIKIVKSSEWEALDKQSQSLMLSQSYKLSPSSSRMGYRLQAQSPLKLASKLEMPSHGVSPGTIQLPPSSISCARRSGRARTSTFMWNQ